MPKQETHGPEDEVIRAKVSSELDEAKQFANTLNFDEAKSGEWFVNLLQQQRCFGDLCYRLVL